MRLLVIGREQTGPTASAWAFSVVSVSRWDGVVGADEVVRVDHDVAIKRQLGLTQTQLADASDRVKRACERLDAGDA